LAVTTSQQYRLDSNVYNGRGHGHEKAKHDGLAYGLAFSLLKHAACISGYHTLNGLRPLVCCIIMRLAI
tara:strand:- start:67 stop:273 length:207 start_codon:yes stop_codon:yes gene_type:complete